jgi:hypothetical protein
MDPINSPANDATIPTHQPSAHLPNIQSFHVALPKPISIQQGTPNPTERDIYIWTNTESAVARCFLRDVLSMKENPSIGRCRQPQPTNPNERSAGPNLDFYWLGHVPCRSVHIVGVVVGIDVTDKWTLYTSESILFPCRHD